MDQNTSDFITNKKFLLLYNQLSATHNPSKPNIDEGILHAIGLVIVKFQRLEFNIRSFIGLLSNLEQQVFTILTVKHSFKNLTTTLIALARQKEFYRLDDLNKLIQMTNKAEEIRNQLIHSVWTSRARVKANIDQKKGLGHKWEYYNKEELLQIAEQIDKIDTAIDAIKFDYIMYCGNNGIKLNGVRGYQHNAERLPTPER
ncbi:hypothetical protein [Chamaesiphon sp. OTE_75_metabat_556]|uniref:hypothetical protein n=1 Tax=Chamaesiphon sp. OTE_75_metabat_556 TaxID=2964692 RepID=UPI00286CD6BE|nr:hypothetical protein [Chamaesiphon sp. OTE_75_metabat_556]